MKVLVAYVLGGGGRRRGDGGGGGGRGSHVPQLLTGKTMGMELRNVITLQCDLQQSL